MKNKVFNTIYQFVRENMTLFAMGIYMVLYMLTFFALENRQASYHIISLAIDRKIPFCELFVIPYFLWFFYVSVTFVILCFKDKAESERLATFLSVGMSVFLLVSFIYPNGLDIRPKSFARDNIFVDMVKYLYTVDTSTNVVPSIHVYNSIAIMISVNKSRLFENRRLSKLLMNLLGVSIILSTVFIKQHSMLDVMVAFLLAAVMYSPCYSNKREESKAQANLRLKRN